MDGVTGPGGPTASSATGSLYNSSELWQQGSGPLTFHKAGRHADSLQGPAWRPGVVRQARGSLKGSSQELSSRIKSFSSRWWFVPACTTLFKSFLRKLINMKVVLFGFYMLLGLT